MSKINKVTLDGEVYVSKYIDVGCDTCVREEMRCWFINACRETGSYHEWLIRPTLNR